VRSSYLAFIFSNEKKQISKPGSKFVDKVIPTPFWLCVLPYSFVHSGGNTIKDLVFNEAIFAKFFNIE
jgi:hypothetical protein